MKESAKKREAEFLREVQKFVENGGDYDVALAMLKVAYGRSDEETETAPSSPPRH